jgi:hypothetical protein
MTEKEDMTKKILDQHLLFHKTKIELEKLRHKNIMQELEYMKKNGITIYSRSG